MPQDIQVDVIRTQVESKVLAIETALSHNAGVYKTIDKVTSDSNATYTKEYAAWKNKVAKVVSAQIITGEWMVRNLYRGVLEATVEIDPGSLVGVGPAPVRDRESNKVAGLRGTLVEVPKYYDGQGRLVASLDAIVFHFKKVLDLLNALPNGTATVTIRDFNFITRY